MNKMRNILIVDDTKFARRVVNSIISKKPSYVISHFNIFEATNGKQALEYILKGDMDIVLLDINMPILNGYDVLKELKNKQIKTRIVVITADKTVTWEKLDEYDVRKIIYKPFEGSILWEELVEILEELEWNELEGYTENIIINEKPKRSESKTEQNEYKIDTNIKERKITETSTRADNVNSGLKYNLSTSSDDDSSGREEKVKNKTKNPNNNNKSLEKNVAKETNEIRLPKDKSKEILNARDESKPTNVDTKKSINNLNTVNKPNLSDIKSLKEKINEQKKESSKTRKENEKETSVNFVNEDIRDNGVKNQINTYEEKAKLETTDTKDALTKEHKNIQNQHGEIESLDFDDLIEIDLEDEFDLDVDINNEIKNNSNEELAKSDNDDDDILMEFDFDNIDDMEIEIQDEPIINMNNNKKDIAQKGKSKNKQVVFDDLVDDIDSDFLKEVISLPGEDIDDIQELDENKILKDLKDLRNIESEYISEVHNDNGNKESKNDIYPNEKFLADSKFKNKSDDVLVIIDDQDEDDLVEIDIGYDDYEEVEILPHINENNLEKSENIEKKSNEKKVKNYLKNRFR